MTLQLRWQSVAKVLGTIIILLTVANLGIDYLRLELNLGYLKGIAPMFAVGSETSIPTFYSAAALLLAGLILLFIYLRAKKLSDPNWRGWLILAIGFIILPIDEAAQVHELVYALTDGYQWVFVFLAVVLVAGLMCLRLLLSLPRLYKALFIASGTLFVGGAVGFELLGDLTSENLGSRENWSYALLRSAEEFLEMVGVAIFICSLMHYLENECPGSKLQFGANDKP